MKKSSTLNFAAIDENKDTEDQLMRLARLWATLSVGNNPVTDFQQELHDMKAAPYTHISPSMAMALFMKESKLYVRAQGPASFFEVKIRDNDIRIAVDTIYIDDKPIIPVGGSLVALTPQQVTARDCANIIALYTRVKGEENPIVTDAAELKSYKAAKMPMLQLTHLRRLLNCYTTDVIRARNEMYSILVNPQDKLPIIFVTSQIYSNPALVPYRKEDPKILTYYENTVKKVKATAVIQRAKDPSIPIPQWPEIKMAYTLWQGDFAFKVVRAPEHVWRFFLTSCNVRGGQKKIGAISRGYYRFDISPPMITEIEEVTDVLMICRKFNFNAVTLEIADVRLALNLAYNQITVYCPGLSSKTQHKNIVGVYARGSMKSFLYRACDQEPPKCTKHSVEMPDPVTINGSQPVFVVEHIPNAPQGHYKYLPSCKAAQGLCIKTNQALPKKYKSIPLSDLLARFCTALWYRNWFVFTRLTYVSQDPYQDWFNTSWIMPQIKPLKEEDFFVDGISKVAVSDKPTLQEIKVSVSEQGFIQPEEVFQYSEEEIDACVDIMNAMADEPLANFFRQVSDATVPVDSRLYALYITKDQDDLIEMIRILQKARAAEQPVKRSTPATITPTSIDPPIVVNDPIEPDDDEIDIWAGGEERVVHIKR